MEIKLYSDNDTRPHGSYSKVLKVNIPTHADLVEIFREDGERIITNLRYKLVIAKGEDVEVKSTKIGITLTPAKKAVSS